MSKFNEVYEKIAVSKNYVEPTSPRMDNWAADRYEDGEYFAVMADGGYTRWVGKRDADGKVLWRVSSYFSKPLEYAGISVGEFEALVV